MSAQLANASATFSFQGASVTLACGSPDELLAALAAFGFGTKAANDTAGNVPKAGATAPAGKPASQPAASSALAAAAPVAQGEQGNAAAAASAPAAPAASPASSPASGPSGDKEAFEQLKKAFLDLSATQGGREKCEAALKPFGLAKLSHAKPEQYAAVLAEIQKQAGA